VQLNTLDNQERGEKGVYLTVLGTSAEGADGGEVGRGNRVNGLIAFSRPQSMEAAAGKNPVSHVGKIYNVLAREIAGRIHREIQGITEIYVFLCSQIGKPIDQPLLASAQITTEPGVSFNIIRQATATIINEELADIGKFITTLSLGKYAVC